jgi:hypothetical protein
MIAHYQYNLTLTRMVSSPQKARLGQILTGLGPTMFAFGPWQSVSRTGITILNREK